MANHIADNGGIEEGSSKRIFRSYLIGYVICLLLTALAFDLTVHSAHFDAAYAYGLLTILAIAQVFIQVIFFLRLNTRSEEGKWNFITFVFTILIVAILILGTLWIMYNLNVNMAN